MFQVVVLVVLVGGEHLGRIERVVGTNTQLVSCIHMHTICSVTCTTFTCKKGENIIKPRTYTDTASIISVHVMWTWETGTGTHDTGHMK